MSKMEDLNKYQKKTDREHILDNPDTYIGSIELVDSDEFILSTTDADNINKDTINKLSINRKKIHYIPGLYKLFDEGIVNCRDHVIRMQQKLASGDKLTIPVTNIEIDILDDGTITMSNDGNGIDIAEHPEYKIWIPELIFGHLRTSTNYDKTEKKIVGGKNGFGFKLVLVWSVWGKIETVDHTRGLKYVQEFHNNLETIDKPKITKATKTKPYTKVYFKPDYKRLGLPGLTDDIIRLLKRRVYDIAAVTDKSVKVKLNNEVVPVKNFCNYISLILGGNDYKHEESNERWEYAVALTPIGEFMQVSFVNGIYTNKGGKHVEYILNQITKKLIDYIKQKKKVDVKPSVIKEQIALFIRCDIENPAFDSQTKDYMNLPASKFGSSCTVSDKFIDKIAKMGLMNTACDITDIKENKNAKKSDGNKTRSIRGIPKLIDANYAGTNKSNECTIILCEGDSAKSGIVSGLSREDRNYIGIYPMKGKLFNIRGECITKINENKEISEIKQILGLEHGRTYTSDDVKTILRYGKVLFMTDQDLDGSHIKGLGINMIDTEWRSLIEIPEFIGYMNTPILKATRANNVVEFYNNGEFEVWKKDNDVSKYKIKYYKGLGTSTGTEFKEYFKKKKIVYFVSNGESCINTIDMVFNKKRSNDRKTWLEKYDRESYLDTSKDCVSYEEFIDNDLIHFSKYDNDRSIPNLIDGLKISQRKILYSAFKKNLTSEIKVAQFSGYVSEQSGYHHGEASLNGTIIGLAQDFVGSNNINLFEPLGQHGCVDPETNILLWNGQIEKAKNIKINDELIGDDGEKRVVSKLVSGEDDMYEIVNGNLDNYIVNSNHILTLYFSGHKSIYWKESSKSWSMYYFDYNTKTCRCKSFRTELSTSKNHFNKSKLTKEETYEKLFEFAKTIPDDNKFDINVQDYLLLPNSVKYHLKGIINDHIINWEHQELEIDPYILGLWLGDGMSNCSAFAGMDHEIIKCWAIWLDTIGCEICHSKNIPPHENHTFYIRRRGSSKKYCAIGDINHSSRDCVGCLTSKFVSKACDWQFNKNTETYNCLGKNNKGHQAVNLNPFKELFKKYNLFNNKHVPKEFIFNSESNRLKILAGMIDSDGTLKTQKKSCAYEISQCKDRKHLLESFRIIAGSLGFRAKIYSDKTGEIYTLSIIGNNIDRIPVQVERKKIILQERIKNTYKVHNIKINSIGRGKFCGWNIDKNERFLLGDFTITHNTRIKGGKDAASERYIFTNLNRLTRLIFPEIDNKILTYLDDDGVIVEPIYYVPIIPMVLVNGCKGIGTGFSTDIMCHNPLQIIEKLESLLNYEESHSEIEIEPYYKGFRGTIEKIPDHINKTKYSKYLLKGIYEKIGNDKIRITELPIGSWTQDYKEFLESLITTSKDKGKDKEKATSTESYIKDYTDMSTDTNVEFIVSYYPGMLIKSMLEKHENGIDGVQKLLKLYCLHSTSNMHLFNEREQLKHYDNVNEIIEEYYSIRLEYYNKRRTNQIDQLNKELIILSNKAKYIGDTLDDKIDLRKKSRDTIDLMMEAMKFEKIETNNTLNFNYLIKMPMDSVCQENVDRLMKETGDKVTELEKIKATNSESMWLKELSNLKQEYLQFIDRNQNISEKDPKSKVKSKK